MCSNENKRVCEALQVFMGSSPPSETVGAIKELFRNILREPSDPVFRTIPVSSSLFMETLLPVAGAMELLTAVGFEDRGDIDAFVLKEGRTIGPINLVMQWWNVLDKEEGEKRLGEGLWTVDTLRSALAKEEDSNNSTGPPKEETRRSPSPVVLVSPPISSLPPYLSHAWAQTGIIQLYESISLQGKALACMPLERFKVDAEEIALLQKNPLKGSAVKEYLLPSLLKWFKEEFFSWFDKPSCGTCDRAMTSVPPPAATAEDLRWGGQRVEGYRCSLCGEQARFVRYNHPEKLLETRKGRCGEWANCFTLCLRALGFPARWVTDNADHVWSEVFLESSDSWVHMDPCEGVMDQPLIYEAGWGKKQWLVLAVSVDEIVDVTWRYSMDHAATRQRRRERMLSEVELMQNLSHMTRKIQESFLSSPEGRARKEKVMRRRALELAGFLTQRNAKSCDMVGRQSGSVSWRTSRGEMGSQTKGGYVFKPDAKSDSIDVRYSCVQDRYSNEKAEVLQQNFEAGVWKFVNVFRKKELDWKMVYLARNAGTDSAEIEWKFESGENKRWVEKVVIRISSTVFETGKVEAFLRDSSNASQVDVRVDGVEQTFDISQWKCSSVVLSIRLSGGQGSSAWQHAQLFRQSLKEKEWVSGSAAPFRVCCFFHRE
ncbi:unnamed protein product [Cyprideis torosa]|uniref:Peptide-N(4)-(N-acetyl-beta-glucosaminyl)asparagine amidase n=1 Tax=Cyprideis torosa TaxID=163714 RepID=A0A7R8WD57_9CRUS|nr:unnamed protein product [Cyprideis torosa]CAG0892790.1 unnamed protein product [Cyprideis torosa]